MLFAIATAKRGQSLNMLDLKTCNARVLIDPNSDAISDVRFILSEPTKTYRASKSKDLQVLVVKPYPAQPKLCPVRVFNKYVRMTKDIRISSRLFVSYEKPHDRVSRQTISRWILTVMRLAGVNTDKFKSHSVRSASVSKAHASGVPIQDIIKAGGWTTDDCFLRYYLKPTEVEKFQSAVLSISE